MTTEAYLSTLAQRLGAEYGLYAGKVHVSVGFPSKGALSTKRRSLGQCWTGEQSADGAPQIFVTPTLPAERVADVLLHELVHATVGCKAGHRKPFSTLAKAVGLLKPWTATTPSPELSQHLNTLTAELGEYPYPLLSANGKVPQKTRLLLLACNRHGVKLRIARATYEEHAPFTHGDGCELFLQGEE